MVNDTSKVGEEEYTYLDPGLQTLSVFVLECFLDISQIDLGSADDNADQCSVLGSHTGHGVMETLSEVVYFRFAALNWKKDIFIIRFC